MTVSLRFVGSTGQSLPARHCLRGLRNTWLYSHELDAAKALALHGTDEECEVRLRDLEIKCGARLEQWRHYQ